MSARRLVPAALVALACGAAAAPAGAATGDVAIADEGSWLGQTGRVLQVGSGGGAASLLVAGDPLRDPWAVAIAGDEIPQGARIVAVCDAFSAMVQERPYQPGLTLHEAVEEIVRCAGTHFDPDVVAAFAAEIGSEAVHA